MISQFSSYYYYVQYILLGRQTAQSLLGLGLIEVFNNSVTKNNVVADNKH